MKKGAGRRWRIGNRPDFSAALAPLLVDGLEQEGEDGTPYPFGGQTHPSGKEHPNTGHVVEWSDASVVRLVAGQDITCDPNSGGDLDGNGKVEFADFLTLSGNFGKDVVGHAEGDIDCNGKVEFADFLVLSGNFGKDIAAAQSVPEPVGFTLLGIGAMLLGLVRRNRDS